MRATLVQGIPFTSVLSAATSDPSLCAAIPHGARPRRPGAVTSIRARLSSLIPKRSAADRCESTASGPQANTVAIYRASLVSGT